MRLRVLLPFQVFVDASDIERIVVETSRGSLGLMPRRLDCVAALVPGILSYTSAADGEVFLAIDEGVMVKTGPEVRISARRAIGGSDLDQLREDVVREFQQFDAQQRELRLVLARLDGGVLRRFASLQRD